MPQINEKESNATGVSSSSNVDESGGLIHVLLGTCDGNQKLRTNMPPLRSKWKINSEHMCLRSLLPVYLGANKGHCCFVGESWAWCSERGSKVIVMMVGTFLQAQICLELAIQYCSMLGQGSYMQPVLILQNQGKIVVKICLPCQASGWFFFRGESSL